MNELTNTIKEEEHPPVPVLSSLSPSLLTVFTSYGGVQRKLFRRLYLALWRYLFPVSSFSAVAHCYDMKNCLAKFSPRVSTLEFLLLSRLWLLSFEGTKTVDSRMLNLIQTDGVRIKQLKAKKILSGSTFDPLHPHLINSRANQPVFLSFTPSGVIFYKDMIRQLNKSVQDGYYYLLRYNNKKGRD